MDKLIGYIYPGVCVINGLIYFGTDAAQAWFAAALVIVALSDPYLRGEK